MGLTGLFFILNKKGQSFREIYLFYTVFLFSEIQVSLCPIIALVTTKEDLSLMQQAQVHKNIGTNFSHQNLICMVHKIHLNPSNLSTSDGFQ